MKHLVLFIFVCISIKAFSQRTPSVTLKDGSQLKLTSLKVDVKITGNFATTTYDMQFYNASDRTLEGELAFPLGEGQSVSAFAMDVNGKLRDAVIVEKELARVAFETTVRQNIDPGLLEKTEGNNYKARVYPILPNANKHIVITYEQELFTSNDRQTFELPLGIKETLHYFSINMTVFGGDSLPSITNNPYKNFFFNKSDNAYQASLQLRHHNPNKPIIIHIPNASAKEKMISYQDYFYAYKTLKPTSRLKAKPSKIVILWDASYSLKYRNVTEELKLLKNYLAYLQNVEVQFISFSNAIHQNKTLVLNKDNWPLLEKMIKDIKYDGGTSLNLFKKLKIKADETLLFSDGLANLGNFTSYNKAAVYTINSTVAANHETLKSIATNSGGNYINLLRHPYTEALQILKQETYQFLGVKNNVAIKEVYPNKNTNITTDFSISGRFSEDTTIELLFGYRGKVTERVQIPIKKTYDTKLVQRLWAKQKLAFLNNDKAQNKEAIIALAKRYHLLTDFTSMLILDRIEDYVRYRIEPPQELKADYKELIAVIDEKQTDKIALLKERKEELSYDYKAIYDWYNTSYPKKNAKKIKKTVASNQPQNDQRTVVSNNQQASRVAPAPPPIKIDSTKRIIRGTVIEDGSYPIPGVNVMIKGTTYGTSTDFDGNFSLNAEENDELVFSFIGYTTQNVMVGNSNRLNISLNADNSTLDEVVVIGYGARTEKRMMTSSVSSMMSRSLAGKTAGVNVTNNAGAASSVTIRGKASIALNSQPFYIVDGIPVTGNPTTTLKPEEIDAMQVIDGANATVLYGARAANGIIIITTKKGKEANKEAIATLNQKISEKIELKSWNPDTPYIKILEKEKTVAAAYKKYLEIRNDYANSPSFYLDVSDFFDKKNNKQKAITILTNLIEVDLNNHELMKALAYKLEYFDQTDLAVMVYKKVLALRPEEPQSYRDLALAYELNGQIQKSFDLLYKIYNGELLHKDDDERYYGIEQLAYVELTRLVHKYSKQLKLSTAQKNSLKEIPVDVRIVIDWNHNDTDIDLWVFDPKGEKAYYGNNKTKIGGKMSSDMTDGYGPESFMLKRAIKGNYKILIDYYSDNIQKISGPTILKVTLFTNYGRKNEQKKVSIVRLDKKDDEIEIGNLQFRSDD